MRPLISAAVWCPSGRQGSRFFQSKDQENNPLEVGKEAHAQILSFEEAQRVVFSLQALDFDAYVYVDYYDKDGTVLRVLPNTYLQDNHFAANVRFSLGDEQEGRFGEGWRLEVSVAPPSGPDIVAASGTTRLLNKAQHLLRENVQKNAP